MKESIKEWYCKTYPTDELGKRINGYITFSNLLLRMLQGEDIYFLIGVSDSIVRERIFTEIAARLGWNYNVIYNLWLEE